MKTNTAVREVTTHAGESSTFSISNNAKIFRILIDGLYADKMQSVTREIWSNALDAHVAAGIPDRPFDVSFPNVFDPTFRVRDYGVSLTHDQVMHLYTDLGNSTKDDTNDAIGKFGIGSKSPFAYTDNFTVTVWLDGEKRYYSALIGGDGVPAIHLMGTEPTDEENGVEVAFPVAKEDTKAFANAAKRISHGFDVKPNVTNRADFEGWPELDCVLEGENWKLLNGAIEGYRTQAYARMGPVLYPINVTALEGMDQMDREVLKHTFVIDFDMGDLEITASREELSYGRGEPTADSIQKRVKEVSEELAQKVRKEIEDANTYFEACCMYRELLTNSALPAVVRNIAAKSTKWRGVELKKNVKLPRPRTGYEISILTQRKLRNITYRFSPHFGETYLDADRRTVAVLVSAKDKKVPQRMLAYVNQLDPKDRPNQLLWVRVNDIREAQHTLPALMDTLDGVTTLHTDDLPEVSTPKKDRAPRRPVQARKYQHHAHSDFAERVDIPDADFQKGGFYVPLERMQVVSKLATGASFSRFMSLVYSLGIIDMQTPVIGAPKSMWGKFEGKQWVNIFDYAKEWMRKQTIDIDAETHKADVRGEILRDRFAQLVDEIADEEFFDARGSCAQLLLLRDEADALQPVNTGDLVHLSRHLNIEVTAQSANRTDLLDRYNVVLKQARKDYPIISELGSSYRNTIPVDTLADYVRMCDTLKNTNQA